jgi:hypothetical protein
MAGGRKGGRKRRRKGGEKTRSKERVSFDPDHWLQLLHHCLRFHEHGVPAPNLSPTQVSRSGLLFPGHQCSPYLEWQKGFPTIQPRGTQDLYMDPRILQNHPQQFNSQWLPAVSLPSARLWAGDIASWRGSPWQPPSQS